MTVYSTSHNIKYRRLSPWLLWSFQMACNMVMWYLQGVKRVKNGYRHLLLHLGSVLLCNRLMSLRKDKVGFPSAGRTGFWLGCRYFEGRALHWQEGRCRCFPGPSKLAIYCCLQSPLSWHFLNHFLSIPHNKSLTTPKLLPRTPSPANLPCHGP